MYQFSMLDVSKDYGSNSNLGGNLNVKFENNFTLGVEGQFMFGSKYKDLSFLGDMVTSSGGIIDNELNTSIPEVDGRGGNFFIEGGKIFPMNNSNKNSGWHLKMGAGYMFYSAYVSADTKLITQLSGQYSDGYNRLESGWSATSFIGYTYFSKNKTVNGSLGIQGIYSSTKYEGNVDFATGNPVDKSTKSNLWIGPKASVTLVLKRFKKDIAPSDGYYYN